jgi:hypothetical protein
VVHKKGIEIIKSQVGRDSEGTSGLPVHWLELELEGKLDGAGTASIRSSKPATPCTPPKSGSFSESALVDKWQHRNGRLRSSICAGTGAVLRPDPACAAIGPRVISASSSATSPWRVSVSLLSRLREYRGESLPAIAPEFGGVINMTAQESKVCWPPTVLP